MVEPVLCLQRIVLNGVKSLVGKHGNLNVSDSYTLHRLVNNAIADLWIRSCQIARDDGNLQLANQCLSDAETVFYTHAIKVQKAKILWADGKRDESFKTLESVASNVLCTDQAIVNECKFLIACMNVDTLDTYDHVSLKALETTAAANNTPTSWITLAQHLEKCREKLPDEKKNVHVALIVKSYLKSIISDSEHSHMSIHRALITWLDVTAKVSSDDKIAKELNRIVKMYVNKVPTVAFFLAFDLLTSRIKHPSNDTFEVIKLIIVELIRVLPQQSLWMIQNVADTGNKLQKRRVKEILQCKELIGLRTLMNDFQKVVEKFKEFAELPLAAKKTRFSAKRVFRDLPDLLSSGKGKVSLPIKKYLHPKMPSLYQMHESLDNHLVFENAMYIAGMEDQIIVLVSQQRPRRITRKVYGSDKVRRRSP